MAKPLDPETLVVETRTQAEPAETGPIDLNAMVSELEKRMIEKALEACRGHQRKAAEHLGLSYHQMRGLLRKYGYGRDGAGGEPNSQSAGNGALTDAE